MERKVDLQIGLAIAASLLTACATAQSVEAPQSTEEALLSSRQAIEVLYPECFTDGLSRIVGRGQEDEEFYILGAQNDSACAGFGKELTPINRSVATPTPKEQNDQIARLNLATYCGSTVARGEGGLVVFSRWNYPWRNVSGMPNSRLLPGILGSDPFISWDVSNNKILSDPEAEVKTAVRNDDTGETQVIDTRKGTQISIGYIGKHHYDGGKWVIDEVITPQGRYTVFVIEGDRILDQTSPQAPRQC